MLRSDFPLRGADIGHGDYLLTLGSAQSLLCRARTFPRRSEHLLVALPSETHAHHARSSRNQDGPNQPAPSLLHLDGGTGVQSIEHSLLERSDLLELFTERSVLGPQPLAFLLQPRDLFGDASLTSAGHRLAQCVGQPCASSSPLTMLEVLRATASLTRQYPRGLPRNYASV